MDIDQFKRVNDTFGHSSGDDILLQTANLLKKDLRATDTITRLGGDEYIILLPNTNIDDAFIIAEKLRKLIDSTVFLRLNNLVSITASFGISKLDPDTSMNDYYDEADRALYQAKKNGRNQCFLR